MSLRRPTPSGSDELIIDRAGEQAEVVRILRAALAGRPQVVLVEGHAGLGKSRLLRWLSGAATDVGARLVSGTALDGIEVPFFAWSGLAELAPDAFAATPGDSPRPGDEGSSMTHLVRATTAVFDLAARQPLAIVLDDMQWADPASALLLQQLVFAASSRRTPLPLLVAVAARPREDDHPAVAALRRIVREPIVHRIGLAPLSDVGVSELVGALSGRRPTAAELHDVMDRTGGNPLFVRSWVSVQHGRGSDGWAESTGVVHQLTGDRTRDLSPSALQLLEAMAVISDSCPGPLHELLVGEHDGDPTAELVDVGLVTVDGGRVSFVHALFRHAQLDRMGEERVAAVRSDVARRLAASDIVEELPAGLVIDVYRRVTGRPDPERHGRIARRAAGEAYAAGAWSRAADLYAAAVDAGTALCSSDLQRWGIARFRAHDVASATVLIEAADAARDQAPAA
jgi:energy-coupling factor transporter ATP-binding protein EcfA2